MAAAPDPVEVLSSTREKANFQRVARLLISGGTTLLREIFDQICPPSNLPTTLKNPATEKQLKAARLTKPQWDCLYPSPGMYGKSVEFDISLLFKLLKIICSLSPPITGWDALPTSTDHSLAADLARIKHYRNSVYGHVNQNMEITDDEFLSFWKEISEALVRVAGQISPAKKTEWQEAIDNFLKDPLTAEDERNVEELLWWYENDAEVKKLVNEVKSITEKGIERLETNLEQKEQNLELAVRKEAQEVKAYLGEQLDATATTQEVQQGMERLETGLKGVHERLEGKLEEVHQSIHKLNSQAELSQSPGARVRLRIDCETISGPGQRRGSSEIAVTSQEHEAGVHRTAVSNPVVPIVSRKRRAEATGDSGDLPSPQEVLSLIAFNTFQSVDPSKPEELNGFVEYLERVRKVLIVDSQQGSLVITVECKSLEILDGLWEDHCTGHLNEMAQKYLVTEKILNELDLAEVKLTTTILEEEYRACREHLLQYSNRFSQRIDQIPELQGTKPEKAQREHGEALESFLTNLREQVTCSVCLNIFNDPKILPCLHTFCCKCLSNHARASHRQGKFHCLECTAQIDLPKGNRFDTLPTSFFHYNLLSVLAVRQIGDGSGITCAHCKKRSSDVHYCFDCARFMCSNCLSVHEIFKAQFEGHKAMPVKDFQAEDYKALLKRQPFCSEQYHEREITRFFCLFCQSCVCHICIVTDHRNHEVILLDKAADSEKNNIMADAAIAKEKEKALKDAIRKFDETICLLEANFTTAKRGVSQTAERMIAEIRVREREAITYLETLRLTRLEKINSANEAAQSLLKQMNQAVEFAQNLVQRSSSSDIMQNKETLKLRFKELRDTVVPKHQETAFIKFTAASVEDLKLGDFRTEGADAIKSFLEGLDQTLKAGVRAELILSPRTPEGEISNQPDLKNHIQVLIQPSKDVTNVNVSEKGNGKFKLHFTPKVPGTYSIELKINGDKLPACPFTMQVLCK